MMQIIKYNDTIILSVCTIGAYIYSLISSLLIMKSYKRFLRNCMHIPFGFVGGFILNFKEIYGIIFFSLLIIYQTLEEVEHLYMNKNDFSWYDIEGYIIGFASCVYYFYLLQYKKEKYELISD